MHLIAEPDLARYLRTDSLKSLGASLARAGDECLTCQRWLDESPPKRLVFERLYGDLLRAETPLHVLDIGGGLTSFSRELARRHHYVLVDLFAHDSPASLCQALGASYPGVHAIDWYDYHPQRRFDIVVANDLFPNVDQRLGLFIERFLPWASEIRLSLTYYDAPRFYRARRMDGEEIFCMLAWSGAATRFALEPFAARIRDPRLELLGGANRSVYPNGRQVCLVTISGMGGQEEVR